MIVSTDEISLLAASNRELFITTENPNEGPRIFRVVATERHR